MEKKGQKAPLQKETEEEKLENHFCWLGGQDGERQIDEKKQLGGDRGGDLAVQKGGEWVGEQGWW